MISLGEWILFYVSSYRTNSSFRVSACLDATSALFLILFLLLSPTMMQCGCGFDTGKARETDPLQVVGASSYCRISNV